MGVCAKCLKRARNLLHCESIGATRAGCRHRVGQLELRRTPKRHRDVGDRHDARLDRGGVLDDPAVARHVGGATRGKMAADVEVIWIQRKQAHLSPQA
jgi:hypothetical protein